MRKRLVELRVGHDMTQADLGRRVGKDRSAISKYEQGSSGIPSPVLYEFSVLFQATMEEIMRNDLDAKTTIRVRAGRPRKCSNPTTANGQPVAVAP